MDKYGDVPYIINVQYNYGEPKIVMTVELEKLTYNQDKLTEEIQYTKVKVRK